jgi:hypothetical protein
LGIIVPVGLIPTNNFLIKFFIRVNRSFLKKMKMKDSLLKYF